MRRKCCVPSCDLDAKCSVCRVAFSFFKTPREPSMIKKWELALGLKSQSLRPHDRICSLHFRKADIVTKRFVSLKRPTRNSKIILEMSKLKRHAVPTMFSLEKQCNHRRGRFRSTLKCNSKSCRTESAASKTASSQSDDTDDSTTDEEQRRQSRPSPPAQRQKDCRTSTENVANLSGRRQMRALNNQRDERLEDKKILVREIRLMAVKITEFGNVDKSPESEG